MYPRGGLFGAGTFLRETNALVARMTTAPAYSRKIVINNAVGALIRAGLWTKLDVLYVLAGHTSQASLLNWKGATYNATNYGATFTTDRGFTGNAVAAYIDTGYNPGNGQFLDASHTFGRWTRTAAAANNTDIGTQDASYQSVVTGGSSGFTARDGAASDGVSSGGASAVANVAVVRNAGSHEAYRNGVSIGTDVAAYVGPTHDFALLAKNNAGTVDGFSANEVSAAYFGDKLTAAQVLALHNILQTYMTAVGA